MKTTFFKKYAVLIFMGLSVLLRLFSFFPSVLDHDESTYLIIGREILQGKELYTDVTDTKPAGIFLFYAALEFLVGGSIFLKRFAFALVVGITAYLLTKVSQLLFKNWNAAFAAGLIYIFYTSIWVYHGLSPNTELLFNLTTISTLLLFLQPKLKTWVFGGLIMGIGFIIKYLVLFDLIAFMAFFFVFDIVRNSQIVKRPGFWGRYVGAGLAFLLPFGLLNLFFWLKNPAHDFFYVTYELPGNYGSNPSMVRCGTMLADFIGKFLPISFFLFYVLFKRSNILKKEQKWFFVTWVICILIAIYLPGKEFSHYTIQLMLPLSLIAGLFFHSEFKIDRYTSAVFTGRTGWALLFLAVVVIQIVGFKSELMEPDYPREVAAAIKQELDPGEDIYVGNYEQIIYYLLDEDSPTKYIHPNLIFTKTHKAFEINVDKELARIMSTEPDFVTLEKDNPKVIKLMKSKYRLVKKFKKGRISLYCRN
ncbi:Dolichyl-phosphate-mannose-protein mannosyltransferase [Mariniphaga anaerophila]|uniref:Dolichyl-phosphate-mannose-protein mannosyltransferase n=1 Tax=Mariniphaga anaerophila TaxID=1484053 RepID=A0A1M4YD51_9BACT|nr:glycosyltransferase family 39 protein [Mariniphaga anaerophila]SHF03629.1 Dolichyl-phosphate-mannose-protein mannosyltransferase [Mariniphaga anaerophila]